MEPASRISRHPLALACLCLLFAPNGLPAKEKGPWTVDDVLLAESAGDFRISPDSRWVVWVKTKMDKEKGETVSNLWLSSLTEDHEIRLTRTKARDSRPRWSPDGEIITFLSTRPLPKEPTNEARTKPAETQLWAIDPEGGEPWPLVTLERAMRDYDWKDRDTIVFAAEEDPALYERQLKEKKDTSRVVEDERHTPPVRLFELRVKEKKIRHLTSNTDWIDALSLSPDGRWAVTRHQRSLSFEYDNRVLPVTNLTDLETLEQKQIFEGERIVPYDIEWSRDTTGFYVAAPYSTDPRYLTATINLLYYYDLKSGDHRKVDLGWEAGLGFGGLQTTPDGFVAFLADGVRFKPARFVRQGEGWSRSEVQGTHGQNILGWLLGDDGATLVYEYSTASKPTQWVRARLDGSRVVSEAVLTHLNPDFDDKPKPKSEIVHWKGARNERVDGVLHYPLNYEQDKRYPLILMIHGGPTGVDMDRWTLGWSRPIPLLCERGAFVFRVNYHGSGNYPLEWVESIGHGNYYELEIPDIESGVDALIDRGLADPDKLATMGWSNGAILSSELVTRSPRYKAVSAGAGDIEWISDWGNVDFGASFDNYYFGASPLEAPELYIRKSPFFRLKNVTAPTLLFTGTEDRNVPPSQSWSHYRALQQLGQVEVRLVLFPGEPHGLRKLVHQRRKVEEELVWFERHLLGTYEGPNEALKEGSPLDTALKRARASSLNGRYGARIGGILAPELVAYEGLDVGRFEVTRAQFAEFDPDYRYEPGTENFPANGVSFDQARAYCEWLSKTTGQGYRLPQEAEVATLYADAKGEENTLDYWAGYASNPDDAGRLAASIAEMPGTAPLLKPVGSFSPRGEEDAVFDLGGNVAEWVVAKNGTGKLLGGSADLPAAPKARSSAPSELYRGFRVVRDETEPR